MITTNEGARRAAAVILGVAFAVGAGGTAAGQEPPAATAPAPAGEEAERRYREAFEAMLADPGDPDAAFRFAEAAVAVGDLDGAIAALERILLIDPDRPDIKLRLGELYERVGAPEVAQLYLGRGLEAPAVPPEVRERAEALREQAEAARAAARARHRFAGSLFLGGRYETNANAAPGSNRIRLFGFEGPFLEDEDTDEDDFSVVGSADLDYAFDFGTQAGHALEADLLLYGARYLDVAEANTWLVDFELGPRFFLGPDDAPFASIRPFGEVSYLALDDETYRTAYGGGLNARAVALPNLLFDVTVRAAYQDFDDTDEQPTANEQTGVYVTLRPGVTWEALPGTLLSLDGLVGHNEADEDFETFTEYGVALTATQLFGVPFAWTTEAPWSVSATGAYRRTDFDEPDPQIDPDEAQEDDRFDVSLSLAVPFTDDLALSVTGQQTFNESNLPNEEFDNTSVTVGVAFVF